MNVLLDPSEIARVLDRLIEQGWSFPVHYSVISNNGSMMLGRYWKPGKAEIITSHCPSGQFVLPMNMMVVDEGGQAALIKWLRDAEPVIVD